MLRSSHVKPGERAFRSRRFKQTNDEHDTSSAIRRVDVATAWAQRLLTADVLARFGGDEFVVLFPAACATEAIEILARLRSASDQQFSAGIVEATGSGDVPKLLTAADKACYAAKQRGRGHVQIAPTIFNRCGSLSGRERLRSSAQGGQLPCGDVSSPRLSPTAIRIARPVQAIGASLWFYVEVLGLEHLGGFHDHDGYDGACVGVTGGDWHLEFTSNSSGSPRPNATDEDLLVLYLSKPELAAAAERLADAGSRPLHHENPYWASVDAVVVRDPDHYLLVLCPDDD